MRKYVFMTLLASLLIAAGCKDQKSDANTRVEKITNVEVYTVKDETFNEFITLPVVVAPFREASLGLVQGGKVIKIHADKGDFVPQGKVLLETDTDMLKAGL